MSKVIEKIGGEEYILLSYPFKSNWKIERFEKRCLDLGGITQGAAVNNSKDIVTVNMLLPVKNLEEFQRLEAEDEKAGGSGIDVSRMYKSAFISMAVAFLAAGLFYILYLIFTGNL